jgi:superfamily II DNA or RNA helicase
VGSYTGDWVTPTLFPKMQINLWSHQQRIVDAFVQKQNCLIRAPTGSGKTTALLAAIVEIQLPTVIIVWDSKLLIQWLVEIEKELGIPRKEVGIIQGSKIKLKPLTVAMQQTLNNFDRAKWEKVTPVFGCVACDEVQRYSAKTFQVTIDQFPARFRVGVSADEQRKDGKECLIYDMFGDVAIDVSKRELEAKGIIHNVMIRIIPTEFTADWYVEQDETKGVTPDHKQLLAEMVEDEDRNAQIMEVIKRVMKTDPGFVFTHRRAHAAWIDTQLMQAGIKSGLLLGGPKAADAFEATKAGLQDQSIQIGVGTYQAIGVGQNIPSVAVGLCTTPMHTNKQQANQVKGRLCRKSDGKDRAIMYVMWDRHVHGRQVLLNLKRWNTRVSVLDDGRWTDVAEYLETMRHERRQTDITKAAGIFA